MSLSQREREDLERIFCLLDNNNNNNNNTEHGGRVSLQQLRTLLVQVSKEGPRKRPALEAVLRSPAFSSAKNSNSSSNTAPDRLLSFAEFVQVLTSVEASASPAQRVFQLMDVDDKGYIDVTDLQRVASDLGERMQEDELEEMIQRAATSKPEGGRVTLADLEAVLHQKLFA